MKILFNFLYLLIFLTIFVISSSQPLPTNYTEQEPIKISSKIQYQSNFIFSPNQTSVAWFNIGNQKFTYLPSIYYPHNQKLIQFHYLIVAMDFSPMGDALFIASYSYDSDSNTTVYHFAKYDTDQGFITQPMVKYGDITVPNFNPNVPTQMRVVSNYSDPMDGRLAFVVKDLLFDITLRGPLSPTVRKFILGTYCDKQFSVKDVDYVPINKRSSDNYILYMSGQCFLKYNSKVGNIVVASKVEIDDVSTLMDGEVVLTSSLVNKITYIYQVQNSTLVQVDNFSNYMIHSGTFSKDQNFFIAKNYNSQTMSTAIKVVHMVKNDELYVINNLNTERYGEKYFYDFQQSPYTLKVTFDKQFSKGQLLQMTNQANDVLIMNTTNENPTTIIHRWSLCPDKKYQSKGQCLPCSSNCKTCLNKADQCTSCSQDQIYKLGTCGTCQNQFTACLQCNQTQCLRCNQTANFYLQPVNYKCTCVNGSYFVKKSQQCIFCSDTFLGCVYCLNAKMCQICDTEKHFVQNTTSGTCCCQKNYSLKNNKTCELCENYIKNCIQCEWSNQETFCKRCINHFSLSHDNKSCVSCDRNIYGCLRCEGASCTQCDSTIFFNTTIINGSCVCQDGYFLKNETCLSCNVKGCLSCSEAYQCQRCMFDKNFNPNPVKGSCQCKNGTIPNEKNTQCFYCDYKIPGCIVCSTLQTCTQCDISKYLQLNKQRNGCVCMKNYIQLNNTCQLCSEIIGNCQTCQIQQSQIKCQICLTSFIYESQSNKCKCPDGFFIADDNTCQKKNQQQNQNQLLYILIACGGLFVMIGVFSFFTVKKCKKRTQLTQQDLTGSQINNKIYPSLKNSTLISGPSDISL